MNAHTFFTSIFTSALAALTFTPLEKSAPPAQTSLASPAHALRTDAQADWESATIVFSEDPDAFRNRTLQDLESYALATRAMSGRFEESRGYFRTRLQALREHVDYARAELVKLPSSQGDPDFIPAHAHFYRTMNGLSEAFTEALNELTDGAQPGAEVSFGR